MVKADASRSDGAVLGGMAYQAYSINHLVDSEVGIIMDVEAASVHSTQEV